MKRICVYAIYDFENQTDSYIYNTLCGIAEEFSDIVVVSNSKLGKGRDKLARYTSNIIERKNVGFDCGAFKSGIEFMYKRLEWESYDELLLLNDSFYGPLHSWHEMFDVMSNERIDYWGISRSITGYNQRDIYKDHIQGYFIALRKKIINDNSFREFWNLISLPHNYKDAIEIYEMGLNRWLQEHKYEGTSYMDIKGAGNLICMNENPYIKYSYELIKKYDCPVLKRKAINADNWIIINKLLEEIRSEGYYDVNQIWENWKRYDLNKKIEKYSISEVVDFCTKHSRLYVYGKGLYGKQKMEILNKLGYENAEYVVTKKDDDDDVKEIGDINFSNTDGIIIGVGPKYYDEVYKNAVSLVGVENVLTI